MKDELLETFRCLIEIAMHDSVEKMRSSSLQYAECLRIVEELEMEYERVACLEESRQIVEALLEKMEEREEENMRLAYLAGIRDSSRFFMP